METIIRMRNSVMRVLYRLVLKPIFFRNDPEVVHDGMTKVGKILGNFWLGKRVTQMLFGYSHEILKQNVLGITFQNPIGLSAGFDKNVELTDIFPSVGFGFVEVGSITGNQCSGNPKPRLWRLPKSKSLVVYYGLKNDGCEAIAKRIAHKYFAIPVGMSVAMTNCKENLEVEKGVQDFAKAFTVMKEFGSYITVNISCPNTTGGQPYTDPVKLEQLFLVLDTIPTEKPIFIKLSPDLSREQTDSILDVIGRHRVHGIICTNLTKKRGNEKLLDSEIPEVGGMSGKVVQDMADDMLAYVYKKTGKKYILMGCGGVFTAEDAYKKIRLGASLVQMITGMIFEGPQVISEINQGLVELLKRDGFKNVSEAVGVDNR